MLEAGRRQLGVAHRVLDVLVPEIRLQRTGVDAVIGELEAAGMSEHVRMHWKVEASRHTEPGDHLAESRRRERCTTFAREDEGRGLVLLALEPAERPQFAAGQRVDG